MKISRAVAYRQYQPFADGSYVCRGHAEEGFESTIVRLESDTGLVGLGGDGSPRCLLLTSIAAGARAGVADLLPELVGLEFQSPA